MWQRLKSAINNVEIYLKEKGLKLPNIAEVLLQTSCRPELDVSHNLGPKETNYFQSLIGELC